MLGKDAVIRMKRHLNCFLPLPYLLYKPHVYSISPLNISSCLWIPFPKIELRIVESSDDLEFLKGQNQRVKPHIIIQKNTPDILLDIRYP